MRNYTILQLAQIAGVSTRTLRYYDEIGLLLPAGKNEAGYRIYSEEEVDALQQILFYKELGFELSTIHQIITEPTFQRVVAMEEHLRKMEQRQQQMNLLIQTIKKSIQREKGEITMTNQEKFEGLKKEMIEENEQKYGKEIREKYGEDRVEESNRKMMNLSENEFEIMTKLGEEIFAKLEEAVRNGADYKGECGEQIAKLHKEWLQFSWNKYLPEAHCNLADMYLADPRFMEYYDKNVAGCTQFLRDAIWEHIS